jgi:hypothetical protein
VKQDITQPVALVAHSYHSYRARVKDIFDLVYHIERHILPLLSAPTEFVLMGKHSLLIIWECPENKRFLLVGVGKVRMYEDDIPGQLFCCIV